ncbi:MAG: SIS domain-containing protein [Nocardioides sp.]
MSKAPSNTSGTTEAGGVTPSAGQRYLAGSHQLLERLLDEVWDDISAAAELLTQCLLAGGSLHTFGSGHGHMLAEEAYYRAGGLVAVRPILFDGLMLHAGARQSTALERLPGLAAALLTEHPIEAGDVLLVASNSGGNAVTIQMAEAARSCGASVVAITSLAHAASPLARSVTGPRLHELADVAIDNGGVPGDAIVSIDGVETAVGPTSTVIGAAIVNALIAETVERMARAGIVPAVYQSANLAGGDAANKRYQEASG